VDGDAPVVLFDGVCNLCHGAVQFILDHDRTHALRFASQQSEGGRALMRDHGVAIPAGDPETIFLVESGRVFERSAAALRIAAHLTFPFSLLRALVIVPRPIRDVLYRFVAKNRYRWFGKTNECRVPTPELRARMIG